MTLCSEFWGLKTQERKFMVPLSDSLKEKMSLCVSRLYIRNTEKRQQRGKMVKQRELNTCCHLVKIVISHVTFRLNMTQHTLLTQNWTDEYIFKFRGYWSEWEGRRWSCGCSRDWFVRTDWFSSNKQRAGIFWHTWRQSAPTNPSPSSTASTAVYVSHNKHVRACFFPLVMHDTKSVIPKSMLNKYLSLWDKAFNYSSTLLWSVLILQGRN